MKHGKILKGLGTLVLLVGILLPQVASLVQAAPLPDVSDTGISYTNARHLSIRPKASATIGITDADPQSYFAEDDKGEVLANVGNDTTKFSVTRLVPATPGGTIIPSDKATFKADNDSIQLIVMSNDSSKQLNFTFPNPQSVQAAIDASGALPNITSNVQVLTSGSTWSSDAATVQQALKDCFYGSLGDHTSDGYYEIKEYQSSNTSPWSTVVGIPTFKSTVEGTLGADDINYDIVLYPKIIDKMSPQFDSFVDLIDMKGDTASTFSAIRDPRLTADPSEWGTKSIDKGTTHTFTASFLLNGLQQQGFGVDPGRNRVVLGWNNQELASITNVQNQGGNLSGSYSAPQIVGTATANKTFDYYTNKVTQFGFIIEDANDPTLTQYIPIGNTDVGTDAFNTYTPGSGTGNLFNYLGFEIGYERNLNATQTYSWIQGARSVGCTFPISGLLATTLPNLGADIIAGRNGTGMNNADLSAFKGKYGTWEEVFAPDSSVRVRLAFSVAMTVSGSAFNGGAGVEAKPFMYGSTVTQTKANPPLNAQIAQNVDFFTFEATPSTGAYSGVYFEKKIPVEANVTTGAINMIKVDAGAKPLSGAYFTLKNAAGNYLATTSTPAGGMKWAAQATPTTANTYNVQSDTDGKVTFDGLAVDASDYTLVELQAPTGYKMLDAANYPTVTPEQLNWDEAKTAGGMTQVVNVATLVLPRTGGMGLITLLLCGAGILLIGIGGNRLTRKEGGDKHEKNHEIS